tara:strand:- start:1825 stop:1971 length:147 start_codon:yes stop_codon:yes gene_type:complete
MVTKHVVLVNQILWSVAQAITATQIIIWLMVMKEFKNLNVKLFDYIFK